MGETGTGNSKSEPTGVSVLGKPVKRSFVRSSRGGGARRAGKHADEGHELGVLGGLAALSLDALSSVAYGPEAMIARAGRRGSGRAH